MLPNRTGVFVGFELSALTWNPVPGVKKTTPRGELALKKLAGKLLGAAKASGTPSQLISRRPSTNVPPTPLLAPRNVRKSLTLARMSAGVAPRLFEYDRGSDRDCRQQEDQSGQGDRDTLHRCVLRLTSSFGVVGDAATMIGAQSAARKCVIKASHVKRRRRTASGGDGTPLADTSVLRYAPDGESADRAGRLLRRARAAWDVLSKEETR
jgi:hypothetical protein